ncbi:hypothetical protein AOLI_G00015250 [Acnodon oligacanthus]
MRQAMSLAPSTDAIKYVWEPALGIITDHNGLGNSCRIGSRSSWSSGISPSCINSSGFHRWRHRRRILCWGSWLVWCCYNSHGNCRRFGGWSHWRSYRTKQHSLNLTLSLTSRFDGEGTDPLKTDSCELTNLELSLTYMKENVRWTSQRITSLIKL